MDLSPIAAAMVASAPMASKSLQMGEPQPPVPEQVVAESGSSSLPLEEVKEVKVSAKDGEAGWGRASAGFCFGPAGGQG